MDDDNQVSPDVKALGHLLATARGFRHQDHELFDMQIQADQMAEAVQIYDRVVKAMRTGDEIEAEAALASITLDEILEQAEDDDGR
jgi:hypothetical protein